MLGLRHDLGLGAFVDHATAWIDPTTADRLFVQIRDELLWEAREIVVYGRRVMQPRLIAWAGAMPYRYSGQTLPPRDCPPATSDLCARISDAAGIPFNHVLLNRYRDGNDSMGMHADAEPELGPDPVVATLSLGATRAMAVRPRKGVPGARLDLQLRSGDLLIMAGTCQRFFLHGIPRSTQPTAQTTTTQTTMFGDVATAGTTPGPPRPPERISLTLRQVKASPAART